MPTVSNTATASQISQINQDTYEAEKRQRDRVADAEKQADDAIQEAREKTERMKTEFEKQRLQNMARQEEAQEFERSRGQEELEDLRLNLSAEARRLHREGEKRLRDLSEFYNDEQNKMQTTAKEKEKALIRETAARTDYESKMGRASADAAKLTYAGQLKRQQDEHARGLRNLTETQAKEMEDLKARTKTSIETAEKNYLNQHEKVLTQHQTELADLQHTTEQRLKDIRITSAQRLNDYGTRKSDPFYKVVNMDASVWDMPDAYVLTARIPEHEQDNVSISVTPGQVTLSGKRRSSDQLDLGPGRKVTTSAFQSFSETFPINETVTAKELTKSFEGDQLTITIPKSRGAPGYSQYKRRV